MVLWLLVGLLAASPAAAQSQRGADTRTWYQAYQDGRQQLQRQEWQAAIASLEAAKRTGPRPGRRIPFYGDVFDDFLPDYYLGVAYLNAGRLQDAVTAFNAVREAKLIAQRDREYADFTRQSTAADERARAAATVQVAQAPPDSSPAAVAAAGSPTPSQSPVGQQAARSPDPPATAAGSAAVPAPAPPTAEPAAASTTAAPNSPTGPPVRPASAAAAVASKRPPAPGPSPNLAAGPAGRAQAELEGLTAFFSGDYQRAANLLSALALNRASPRVEFYLACSRAALVLTGGADPATLTEARDRFSTVRADQFASDRRYVSPRVLELLQNPSRQ